MADWEQIAGESKQHYSWFLAYRNLGPTRTLERAYRVIKGDETVSLPGNWAGISSRNRWVERAAAWDVDVLSEAGAAVVTRFVTALGNLAAGVAEGLATHRPASYADSLEGLRLLGLLVPAETVEALQQTAAAREIPAIGGPSPDPFKVEVSE